MSLDVLLGDSRELLKALADNSVDSCVTDPPYHLTTGKKGGSGDKSVNLKSPAGRARISTGFMGQAWDGGDVAHDPDYWREVYRVLKPGAHVAAFAGTRTYHRLACAIEDAGFEIRDMIAWAYGTGFPKSHDISKAIDRAAGAERLEVVGSKLGRPGMAKDGSNQRSGFDIAFGGNASGVLSSDVTAPATDEARQWEGWGTALKPSLEPVCLARKPLSEKTIAANVLKWGTGALNIDATRIATDEITGRETYESKGWKNTSGQTGSVTDDWKKGRWPANLCHDGSDEVVAGFPESDSSPPSIPTGSRQRQSGFHMTDGSGGFGDSGSAARFFYCAKAGKLDRLGSDHPTVKPVALMRWLCRLVTPPGGLVLDPFAGTGSTGLAAFVEGFDFCLMELREEAVADIRRRLDHVQGLGRMTSLEMAKLDDAGHAKAKGDDLPLFGITL